MRTTTNITKDTKTLYYVACFARDGSFICSAFSLCPSFKKDVLAIPLNSIVRYADTLGKKVARTMSTVI